MHIEEGIVQGAKIILSYGTAAACAGIVAQQTWQYIRSHSLFSLILRTTIATAVVFGSFELLPHYPVGVSEVHFIFATSLFLLFGLAPAAIGLALGLLIQGLFFAPFDLPQYGMNVTTLLLPIFAVALLAQKIIPVNTAYKDIRYSQTFKLSLTYQAGVSIIVAFWALYGQGFGSENLANIATFGGAYVLVVIVEPLVDLGLLALCKTFSGLQKTPIIQPRVYQASA